MVHVVDVRAPMRGQTVARREHTAAAAELRHLLPMLLPHVQLQDAGKEEPSGALGAVVSLHLHVYAVHVHSQVTRHAAYVRHPGQ